MILLSLKSQNEKYKFFSYFFLFNFQLQSATPKRRRVNRRRRANVQGIIYAWCPESKKKKGCEITLLHIPVKKTLLSFSTEKYLYLDTHLENSWKHDMNSILICKLPHSGGMTFTLRDLILDFFQVFISSFIINHDFHQILHYLFVTSKNETTNSPIH